MSNYNPYTKRQTMIAPDYEVYRYRSTYMNEVELHHHDFYEIYLLLRGRVEYIVENQLYACAPATGCCAARWSCTRRALPPTPTPMSASCSGSRGPIWRLVHPAHKSDPLL